LERLLLELHAYGVAEVTLESRGRKDDERDMLLLYRMRRGGLVDRTLRLYHRPGPTEPMLWVADVGAGVVADSRIGQTTYYDQLKDQIEQLMV